MRKSNSTFVVKNGVRKMRKSQSVRKFQDSYYVGLAYVGLVELEKKETGSPSYSSGSGERITYRGSSTKKNTPIGDIKASVFMEVTRITANSSYGKPNFEDRWDVREKYGEDSMEFQNLSLWGENLEGTTIVEVRGTLLYKYQNIQGKEDSLYYDEFHAQSVEDCLDMIARASEEAWGEVTIQIAEVEEANAVYRNQAVAFPDTITLQTNEGEMVLGKEYEEGRWKGKKQFSSDNVYCDVSASIFAVVIDENGEDDYGGYRGLSRDSKVSYYSVQVIGDIFDENTQVSDVRNNPKSDSWQRKFTGEGAETLEGAIAIAESNIAEVYQEFLDYVRSEREYQTFGHGVGHARTVENVNPWDYNFGDSYDDVSYERWNSNLENLEEPLWGTVQMDAYNEPEYSPKLSSFVLEYTGQDKYSSGLTFHDEDNGLFVASPSSYRSHAHLDSKTRDDVERACRMSDCQLIEFTDGTHFTINVDTRVSLSARKMAKSRKPRSFNAMVQSIRQRNNQRK